MTNAKAKDTTPSPAELMADMNQHLKATGSEEVVPVSNEVILPRTYGLDFDTLLSGESDTIEGFDLIKSENKHTLIGVPFVVVGVTYRDGISQSDDKPANYVSVEIVTASPALLKERVTNGRVTDRDGKPLAEALVGPNETLVINDGSTGIARQITEYLHLKGLINIGAVPQGMITGGEMGQSPFDRYYKTWPMGADAAERGIRAYSNGARLALFCPRGLRVSSYPNPKNPKDTSYTYYLG